MATDVAGERLRIDELAHRSGIASGTIRFYQREGLVPPPERAGRVAYYDQDHLRRLRRIRALQAQGLPLAVIGDLLAREDAGQDISAWLALDSAVFGRRTPHQAHEVTVRELTSLLTEMGVPAGVVADGIERLSWRLRSVAEETVDLGWQVFARDRERLADAGDGGSPAEVQARFESLRSVAQRLVATLFPLLLEEAIRARSEPYAVKVAARRKRQPS